MEVTDRIASLEQRVQMQEDDIQLLKSALADVVRRLSVAEEQQAALSRKGPTRGARCSAGRRAVCVFLFFYSDLPDSGIKSPSAALAGGLFATSATWEEYMYACIYSFCIHM